MIAHNKLLCAFVQNSIFETVLYTPYQERLRELTL